MDKQIEEMAGGCGWSEGWGKQGQARMPLEARLRSWFGLPKQRMKAHGVHSEE